MLMFNKVLIFSYVLFVPTLSLTRPNTHTHIHALISLFFLNANKMLISHNKFRSKIIP